MPDRRPTAEANKWRFSLKSLFLLMFLAAIVVWLTSWRMWDTDERIILGSWSLVMGSIYFSRRYGWLGIVLTTLAGGLFPAGLAFVYYVVSELFWEYSQFDRSDIPAYAVILALTAATSIGLVSMALTPLRIGNLAPSQREHRLRRRLMIGGGLAAVVILGVVAWSAFASSTHWKMRGEVLFGFLEVRPRSVSLSSDGSHLIAVARTKDPNQHSLAIWKLAPFNNEPVFRKSIASRSFVTVSGDGNWVAIAEAQPSEVRISVAECGTGKAVAKLVVSASSDSFDMARLYFSTNDRELRFVTRKFDDDDEPTSYRWQASDWKPLTGIESDGRAVAWSTFSVRIEELGVRPVYDRKYRIELWDLASKNLLHRFEPFSDPRPIALSPDGKLIAVHDWLIDLETNEARQLANTVEGFLPRANALLCSRQYHPFVHRTFWNESRDELGLFPFVRHLPPDMPQESLLLLDQTTGRVISKSQWVPGYRSDVVVSERGNVALSIDPDRILVWEIPE